MIPLRDLGQRGIPVVTAALVAINIAVWVYVLTLADRPRELAAFYDAWSLRSVRLFDELRTGTLTAPSLVPLLTHEFVHAGWLHIVGNMLFLWVFGASLEARIGRVRYLAFYLLAGLAAALAQGTYFVLVHRTIGLVGASGAISGVLGAYLVLTPTAKVRALVPVGLFMTPMNLPAILVLGEWVVLQIVAALGVLGVIDADATNVAYFAHLGGFAFGVLVFGLARLLRRAPIGRVGVAHG